MILGTTFEIFGSLTSPSSLEDLSGAPKLRLPACGTMAAQRGEGRCVEGSLLPPAAGAPRESERARAEGTRPRGCVGAQGV